jgi:hypothetical protein
MGYALEYVQDQLTETASLMNRLQKTIDALGNPDKFKGSYVQEISKIDRNFFEAMKGLRDAIDDAALVADELAGTIEYVRGILE